MPDAPTRDLSDPAFREGVLDLLGALAYGELVGFFTIVHDADDAPDIGLRMQLAEVAVSEYGEYQQLTTRIVELGGEPEKVMAPFAKSFDDWHQRTRPSSWLEGLMKIYTGNSMAEDFYREMAQYVDPQTRQLVAEVVGRGRHVDFAATRLRDAIQQDAKVAGRLALFGRRMVGEALTQAQHVAADRDAMTALLIADGTGGGGADLAELARMFARITERHTERMEALGLSA